MVVEMNSFMTIDELKQVGFKSFGENVLISRKASIYGAEKIEIGSNVRIDDFCFLSGNLVFGNYIHIAAGVYLYGSLAGIVFGDFSTAAPRTVIHADSDDYSGKSLTNPMTMNQFKKILLKSVTIGRHSIIGTGSVILPGADLAEGTAIGAMSLVTKATNPWTINFGIPCREKSARHKDVLMLEQQMMRIVKNDAISHE